MTESENMKRLRNRNIFEEIKKTVTQIQDTSPKDVDIREQERIKEHKKIIDEIFGDE